MRRLSRDRLTVLVRRSDAGSRERMRMLTVIDANSIERLLLDPNDRRCHVAVILEEVAGDHRTEALNRVEHVLVRQSICDVFHRVGGNDETVVTACIRLLKVPLKRDVDRQLADVVAVEPACDFRQLDPRLSVRMMAKYRGHDPAAPFHTRRWRSTDPMITTTPGGGERHA